jgi:hypothetical protein
MTGRRNCTAQLYFFLMPQEIVQTLEFVSNADVAILASRSKTDRPHELDSRSEVGQSFLCPRSLVAQVVMTRATIDLYFLDPAVSPVVEFDACFLREHELSRGRICLRYGYDGRQGWVAFPDSVIAVFRQVCSFVRRSFLTKERCFGAFLSKAAKEYVCSGGALSQF